MRTILSKVFLTTTLCSSLLSLQAQLSVLETNGTPADGDTLVYIGSPSDFITEIDAYVANLSASPKDVKVKREIQSITPGMETYFCWDICYGAIRDTCDSALTIAAMDTNKFSFHSYAKPQGFTGVILVKYRFYNFNNPSEETILYTKYIFGEVGIEDQETLTVSAPYPNPASGWVNFTSSLPASVNTRLTIYDLSGKEIQVFQLKNNGSILSADLTPLQAGTYLYSLQADGKTVRNGKLLRY